ncbi:MAG: sigma-70 family RNA polymerase sigma factor [Clostridia bacterium]|nr:sigma-70 family RNA polymerase sigma factor [Clostridia bacterium]
MIIIEALVEKAKSGDENAFNELFDSVYNYLLMCAKQRLPNEADAEDIVQITLFKAYKSISTLEKAKSFKYWITKILINTCREFYKRQKELYSLDENKLSEYELYESLDKVQAKILFENIINKFSTKDKTIYELKEIYGYTTKQISDDLDMKENTVKSRLKRIRDRFDKKRLFIILVAIFIGLAGSVAAGYLGRLLDYFNIKTVGKNNDGMLKAILEKDWVQNVYTDYIDLGDGYKITASQLIADEMNLYIIFDFQSEKDISRFNEFTITDLKIQDENNNLICDRKNIFNEQYAKSVGTKIVRHNNHHIKCMIYLHSYEFPISKTLDVSFSDITLSKKSIFTNNNYLYIKSSANFKIDVDEKFINRSSVYYISDCPKIKKFAITETGTYTIIDFGIVKKINKIKLLDSLGKSYNCEFASFCKGDNDSFEYIFMSKFDNTSANDLTLIIDNEKYNLKRTGLEKH